MNIRIQRSGLRAGDDQANVASAPNWHAPDVQRPGSDVGEGGQCGHELLEHPAALNSSGPRVGGEAALSHLSPALGVQPSGTPSLRSRSDVAAAISRSAFTGGAAEADLRSKPINPMLQQQNFAGNGGGEQAIHLLEPSEGVPAAKSSGRKAGAGETTVLAQTKGAASPRKTSCRKAGASNAILVSSPMAEAHPGDNSGRKVGDEQTEIAEVPGEGSSAVRTSGASVLGDEAIHAVNSTRILPRRKSPGRKAGADQARNVPLSSDAEPGPQLSASGRGDESRVAGDTRVASALIAEIVQLGRARRDWMKTRVSIELRGIAICRRSIPGYGDADEAQRKKLNKQAAALFRQVQGGGGAPELQFAVMPLLAPISMLKAEEEKVEKQMTKLAKGLPVAAFAKSVTGFGLSGLAKVVAECGDIGSYRNPSCVWKRMGTAVIEGERQRRVPGADALKHGYNAERRSVLWNAGKNVVGGMGKGVRLKVGQDVEERDDLTYYQKVFVSRIRYWAGKDPEQHIRPPVVDEATSELRESYSAHAAAEAKRYVEKRVLRHLFQAWRRANRAAICPHELDAEAAATFGSGA